MKVVELIRMLKKLPQNYKVEVHEGTDHWEVTRVDADKSHKRDDWWQRRRPVVILR